MSNENKPIRLGIDVGSTTVKIVAIDDNRNILFKSYRRHFTRLVETIVETLADVKKELGDVRFNICLTGSGAMGIADRTGMQFVQEVVAVTRSLQTFYPEARTLIDIGGEDAKLVLVKKGKTPDIRMNGNCAGGTGAFIDQMAGLLNINIDDMDTLAQKSQNIYPIASRCGVFAKTDVQNLMARKIDISDIAASIFHAVALQTINALARGCDILPQVVFCGGPLTYIKSLRDAFIRLLKLEEKDYEAPEFAQLFTALGAALMAKHENELMNAEELESKLSEYTCNITKEEESLAPLFTEQMPLEKWDKARNIINVPERELQQGEKEVGVFIGIDSGSTTTKVIITDEDSNLLYTYYNNNQGNPLQTAVAGLEMFKKSVEEKGCSVVVKGSAVTGYGEDLLHAALNTDHGIVETIAHYLAAKSIDKDVSFILDIGGQDIKAIFAQNGTITDIEINEACSSGCGSFVESFAKTLGYSAAKFADLACESKAPCDLGSRCTVFMNSKVRQALKDGATVEDLSAGLAYSVVKNCLYKVLKLDNLKEIGGNIVVQGGTFKNRAVFRALELLSEKKISSSNRPELMGAYGAALYARSKAKAGKESSFIGFDSLEAASNYETKFATCNGCTNMCSITVFKFPNGKRCYSGNKCEKKFTNNPERLTRGENVFDFKRERLFNIENNPKHPRLRIGIPRALTIYENFPFWQTLFTSCNIEVVLSNLSSASLYEKGAGSIMSDNICFPAKFAHGHVIDLAEKGVDRIFYPFILFERNEFKNSNNCFNCPIVTAYSEVLNNINSDVPLDAPAFNLSNEKLTENACIEYLKKLGVDKKTAKAAVQKAIEAQKKYKQEIFDKNLEIYKNAIRNNEPVIVLAGHPYQTDPMVHQKISDILSDLGVAVVNEEIAAETDSNAFSREYYTISQWAYPNRVLQAAAWVAKRPDNVYLVQMNSFGCGPDAIIIDEIRDLMKRNNKSHTLIRIDEIASTGSIKLRLRSLVESIKLKGSTSGNTSEIEKTPVFQVKDRQKTILIPWFADFYSPYIPMLGRKMNYNIVNLPKPSRKTLDVALKAVNNEVCYPALCVVGDLIAAVKSGKYDSKDIVLGISQTSGQCRATNYIALIKRALINAGYKDIPVVAISVSAGTINEQPGFDLNYKKVLFPVLHALGFSDSLMRLYYGTVSRELVKGTCEKLKDKYIEESIKLLEENKFKRLKPLLEEAVEEFNNVPVKEGKGQVIGIIGEIYVKYNSFGNYGIVDWLISQGIEVAIPPVTNFFTQGFVNNEAKRMQNILPGKHSLNIISKFAEKMIAAYQAKYEKPLKKFIRYRKFESVREEAKLAEKSVNLLNQYGEGWLIPGEIAGFAKQGINNVVCIQPFGCIANHVIGKGIEKKMKKEYPDINLLFLDFDYGTTQVNVLNRLHFMLMGNEAPTEA